MKRILLGAAGAAGLLFGVPAGAQTYQDSGGTYVRGVVPITAGAFHVDAVNSFDRKLEHFRDGLAIGIDSLGVTPDSDAVIV